MKKIIVNSVCLILLLALAGCGNRLAEPQTEMRTEPTAEVTEAPKPNEAVVEDVRGQWREFDELYDRAKELSEKYGISIFIGDTIPEWLGVMPCDDTELTRKCLQAADEVLGCYPEGFFRNMPYDCFDRIYLYITGTGGTAGSYCSESNILWMHIDANCMEAGKDFFSYTLHHELCHMIDYRMLSRYPGHIPSIDNAVWNRYNPEGFRYAGQDDEKQAEVYDTCFEYFAYSYGTCNESEDRAIFFGNAMTYYQNTELLPSWTELPHCMEKYEYYCQCIRREFGWEREAGVLPWEAALKQGKQTA